MYRSRRINERYFYLNPRGRQTDLAPNKTDANDADGLAHICGVGFYREVRVKSFDNMLTRTLFPSPCRGQEPRAADPFSLPTRKGNSQPSNALTLFGLRRGNMAAPVDIYNSPSTGSHGLRTPPTSSLTVSPSLYRTQVCSPIAT
jgi:hypothetical protein